jgi:hypothetical protein
MDTQPTKQTNKNQRVVVFLLASSLKGKWAEKKE